MTGSATHEGKPQRAAYVRRHEPRRAVNGHHADAVGGLGVAVAGADGAGARFIGVDIQNSDGGNGPAVYRHPIRYYGPAISVGANSMNAKKLGTNIIVFGLITLGLTVLWWATFYTQVIRALGTPMELPVQCLYQGGGPCGFVSGMATAMGLYAYTPVALYFSLGTLAVGLLVLLSGDDTPPSSTNAPPSGPSTTRQEPHFTPSHDRRRDRF